MTLDSNLKLLMKNSGFLPVNNSIRPEIFNSSLIMMTTVNPIQSMRQAKHEAHIIRLRLLRKAALQRDLWWKFQASRTDYSYDSARHTAFYGNGSLDIPSSSTFPVNHLMFESTLPTDEHPAPAPQRIFVLWTGDNEMSDNRKRSLDHLTENFSAEVTLVTPSNLNEWVVSTHPLHPAYEKLSLIHRSDYLRAYLAYHHGGGYVDLKSIRGDLGQLIGRINSNPALWGGGMRELGSHNVGEALGGSLPKEQRVNHSRHLWASCYAFRPKNRFTGEWLSEVERRLSYFEPLLTQNPPMDPFGASKGYPVPWFSILGNIFGPLCLKYQGHLTIDESLQWEPTNEASYR
ncbi:hypothetical protein BHE16_04605 [Neomicrococcus aestuarii]|uniref:Uncharacterized protein n=2 Tax=Neomicrococcus aestuarii TaxID=556325 RepID=A0A1L2ZN07_9MICC|nr:hypothetical protein BHE16_04605 [Neomicrococcus aestuarii]